MIETPGGRSGLESVGGTVRRWFEEGRTERKEGKGGELSNAVVLPCLNTELSGFYCSLDSFRQTHFNCPRTWENSLSEPRLRRVREAVSDGWSGVGSREGHGRVRVGRSGVTPRRSPHRVSSTCVEGTGPRTLSPVLFPEWEGRVMVGVLRTRVRPSTSTVR